VHTPQCFRSEWLKDAYKQPYSDEFTDDASVVEKLGKLIHLSDSNEENIKITTPNDLKIAELFLNPLKE
jgi:2-C-methyl-D-erythritol 4-phosphate cytidylyltransferase